MVLRWPPPSSDLRTQFGLPLRRGPSPPGCWRPYVVRTTQSIPAIYADWGSSLDSTCSAGVLWLRQYGKSASAGEASCRPLQLLGRTRPCCGPFSIRPPSSTARGPSNSTGLGPEEPSPPCGDLCGLAPPALGTTISLVRISTTYWAILRMGRPWRKWLMFGPPSRDRAPAVSGPLPLPRGSRPLPRFAAAVMSPDPRWSGDQSTDRIRARDSAWGPSFALQPQGCGPSPIDNGGPAPEWCLSACTLPSGTCGAVRIAGCLWQV